MELIPFRPDAESFATHHQRLGPLPSLPPDQLIAELEASGLLGRGGAGFPVARKWRAVAERSSGGAVVLANGAEGEPLSLKDRSLMAARPHLVIDGALLAARAVGADDITFYIGVEHRAADAALRHALAERPAAVRSRARIVRAPVGYVSGEESAAVHFVNVGDGRPTTTPPRPFERGVGGRPTLVQNVESLALAALIARRGHDWYKALGQGPARGIGLITVSGAVNYAGSRRSSLDQPWRRSPRPPAASEARSRPCSSGDILVVGPMSTSNGASPLTPSRCEPAGWRLGAGWSTS